MNEEWILDLIAIGLLVGAFLVFGSNGALLVACVLLVALRRNVWQERIERRNNHDDSLDR